MESNFDVTFDEKFIEDELSDTLLEKCNLIFGQRDRRTTIILGVKDTLYSETYTRTPVIDWELFPDLLIVKQKLEDLTKIKYNFCAIMCYPNGQSVIKMHRDKEIPTGSQICGISLGCSRRFKLTPIKSRINPVILNLTHGSLYCLLPPTNDHWLHEILPEENCGVRYSLTFRNIPNPLKVSDLKYCPAILKSGPNKGLPCNACIQNLVNDYCGRHNK